MSEYGLDVAFFSHHQFVKVLADGKEIYAEQKNGGIWGHTNGSVWNFVSLPYGTKELQIQFVSAYESVQDEEHTFYFGDKLKIYTALLKKSLMSALVSIILIVMGGAMFIYGAVVNKKVYTGKGLQYLGVFTIILGLWSLNETDAMTIVMRHRITCGFAAYIFLMMLSSSFILFVRELINIEEQKVWKTICNVSMAEFIVCIALQFAGIMDLKETVIITHIIMVIAILYVISVLIYKMRRGNVSRTLKTNLVALIVLIVAVALDLVLYYLGVMDADFFGRFIFLLFVIILGCETLKNSAKVLERGKLIQLYEELATMDILTGLHNRNAYETDVAKLEKTDGILLVTFDLNNLKRCNDTLGHSEGDNYIKAAANIIEMVFSQYGTCYRIGGDEFIMVTENGARCPIDGLLRHLRDEEEKYNNRSKSKFPMHIAVGYAIYDIKRDGNIENARNRADEFMYENKRKIKDGMEV